MRAQTAASRGSRSPLTSLTITAPASIAACATSGLYVSTETTAPSSPAIRRDEWHDALDLLRCGHGRTVGDARLAADVDEVGPGVEQLAGARHPRVEVGVGARIRERVRRGVDDAHEPRPLAERELRPAAATA